MSYTHLHALLRRCKGVDDRRPGPPRPRLMLLGWLLLLLLLLLGLLHRRADPERHLRVRGVGRLRRRGPTQPARPHRRRARALRLLQGNLSELCTCCGATKMRFEYWGQGHAEGHRPHPVILG